MGQEVKPGQKILAHAETATQLPPPGDERREVLKERTDALEEQGEKLANEMEMEAANPAAYRPDNDLQAMIDLLDVEDADHEHFHYCWVQTGLQGRNVRAKQVQGYEVVSGPMVEAKSLKQADGSRRIGDTLLMRIPRERYRQLRVKAENRRLAREEGVSAKAFELARKYAHTGVQVYQEGEIPDHLLKQIVKRQRAQERAGGMMDNFIRDGRVPGMPAHGIRR